MEPKANPAATGVLVAGIVLAPAALVASAAPAPVDPAALVAPAPVVSVVLVRVALVRAAPAHRVDLAVTVALDRRVGPAAMAVPASLGIPRVAPVVTDRVADRVVRISVLNR
jgi:hypothetical protein